MEWDIGIYAYRPDAIAVWGIREVVERLKWYKGVMTNEKPAKFLVAKKIPVDIDPFKDDLKTEDLWLVHEKASAEFKSLFRDVAERDLGIETLETPRFNYLDLKAAIAKRLMSPCRLCPRNCGAERAKGRIGVCLVGDQCVVHSYFHHLGEEAPLVPSGTIFYGGCNLKCVYCQNYDISQVRPREGLIVTPQELASIQAELRKRGARNINHVGGDPIPSTAFILESLRHLDINVPQLWNSNMYMTEETMKLLEDIIDIWLPDLKYGNNECAWRLSKVKNYWETATRNIKRAHDAGDIIIRHLVLPGHVECCTRKVLEWIAKNAPRALVNIMDQYRPEHIVAKYPKLYPEISRRPRRDEILEAYRIAEELGIVYKPVS